MLCPTRGPPGALVSSLTMAVAVGPGRLPRQCPARPQRQARPARSQPTCPSSTSSCVQAKARSCASCTASRTRSTPSKRTSSTSPTPSCGRSPTSTRSATPSGETLDDLLPEAFATVREAAKRVLGQRHYDVQLMGGAALHLGYVAEMRTGEGKTLVGTLPAYLNALSGKGVHLITVNDYLAERDSEWMGRVHKFLGLDVGCILANMTPGAAPRAVRVRHHVRHQQRVRLRLPARQHGVVEGRAGAARPQLRDRRRGRLDPGGRGPYAADHLRPRRPGHQVVQRLRQAGDAADQGRGRQPAQGHGGDRRLRGRREEAHGRHPRARRQPRSRTGWASTTSTSR